MWRTSPNEGPFFCGASSTPRRWQMLATAFASAASNAKRTTINRDYDETTAAHATTEPLGPYDRVFSRLSPLVASGVTFK
jgi:hypothetical protein